MIFLEKEAKALPCFILNKKKEKQGIYKPCPPAAPCGP
jgi:hypothetical protein